MPHNDRSCSAMAEQPVDAVGGQGLVDLLGVGELEVVHDVHELLLALAHQPRVEALLLAHRRE